MTSSRTEHRLHLEASRCCADPAGAILSQLHAPILRILAEGRPATIDELASVTPRPPEQIQEILRRIDPIELDDHGSVLGLGLTLLPTRHRVQLLGRNHPLYAWCAPDGLILPSLIGEAARVTSACPVTSRSISVELSRDAVRNGDPPKAVVSFVLSPDQGDLRGTGCDHQNLFASAEVAANWLAVPPDSEVVPVARAFDLLIEARAACG